MATITYFSDKSVAQVQPIRNTLFFAQNVIDFSAYNANIADVVEGLKIPKGAFVLQAGLIVKTAGTASATCTIGDSSSATSWDATACALDAAADTVYTSLPADTYPALGGKLYTAEGDILLTIAGANITSGKYTVFAVYAVIEDVADN